MLLIDFPIPACFLLIFFSTPRSGPIRYSLSLGRMRPGTLNDTCTPWALRPTGFRSTRASSRVDKHRARSRTRYQQLVAYLDSDASIRNSATPMLEKILDAPVRRTPAFGSARTVIAAPLSQALPPSNNRSKSRGCIPSSSVRPMRLSSLR